MTRLEYMHSGASVDEVSKLFIDGFDSNGCPNGECDLTCEWYGIENKNDNCIPCYIDWLNAEIKAPAESEAQAGAKDISIDSVAHGSEDVKVAFTQTCKRILDEVREAHKEYRTLDFKYDRPEVHMSESSFFDMFDSLEMRAEYSKLISKYEIMASIDGILYFCLSDSDHGLPVEGES